MDFSGVLSLGLTIPALLTGAASLLALVISKENKISEARQTWVAELRDELSKFAALTRQNAQYWEEIDAELSNIDDASQRATTKFDLNNQHLPHAIAASASVARVKLMLAAHEVSPESKAEVGALMARLIDIQRAYTNTQETLRLTMSLHEVAGPVLQREWTRVRAGEPMYRRALALSFLTLVLLLVFGVIAAVQAETKHSGSSHAESKTGSETVSPQREH